MALISKKLASSASQEVNSNDDTENYTLSSLRFKVQWSIRLSKWDCGFIHSFLYIIIIFFNTLWKINRSKNKKLSEAKGKGLDRSQYNNLDTCMHASIGRRWSRKSSWKVADGVATHSKLYWCKGGGWLIMVDISYTTLHKRTGEGGWLATLSTPLDQPLIGVKNDNSIKQESLLKT